jgi:hypothetical protein
LIIAFAISAVLASACGSSGSSNHPDAGSDAGADSGPGLSLAWDWTGVVGTGQSLSVGAFGNEPTNPPSFNNLKITLGTLDVSTFDPTMADPASTELKMLALSEPIRSAPGGYPSAYPRNIDGVTPHSAMAAQVTTLAQNASAPDYVTVHTVVGESGQPMTVINKAATQVAAPCQGGAAPGFTCSMGRAYASTLFEVTAISKLAAAAGKTYGVGAITLIHGESDAGNTAYADNIFQLWSDYNQDISAITQQTASIPMLVSQQNSVPSTTGQVSVSAQQQYKVGIDHPGDIICVGPKYQYPYSTGSGNNGIHLNSQGYQLLGEKMGQVYFERVVAGHDWAPLQATSGERMGANAVLVHFHVPVPPLVWDDTLPTPHAAAGTLAVWTMGRGFEVTVAGKRATITAVDIVGDDTVQITCQDDLSPPNVAVAYAMTSDGTMLPTSPFGAMGTGTFRWGHLKDSDPFTGAVTGVVQPNWAVAFQITIL